ncbi:MAG: endonuclease III [Bacteroidota bacterium]
MPSPIQQAITILEAAYGRNLRYSSKQPMAQLISTVLSQRTKYADERAAFERMWTMFGSWEAIMKADTTALAEAIQRANYPEVKAPRIQEILRLIEEERGDFDLTFLQSWEVDKAQQWLMRFPGVGHKTATFLLLFVFRLPALPVDTHVHRVSQRLGIIETKVSEAKAHKLLKEMLPPSADELLNFHKLFFKHGQQVCTWSQPNCQICVLQNVCNSFTQKKDLFAKHQAQIG